MNEFLLKHPSRVDAPRISTASDLVRVVRQRGFSAWIETDGPNRQALFTSAERADLLKIRHAVRWLA